MIRIFQPGNINTSEDSLTSNGTFVETFRDSTSAYVTPNKLKLSY